MEKLQHQINCSMYTRGSHFNKIIQRQTLRSKGILTCVHKIFEATISINVLTGFYIYLNDGYIFEWKNASLKLAVSFIKYWFYGFLFFLMGDIVFE